MLRDIREKYRKIPLSVKASIWFVVCGALKDVIDILVTPVFTRVLTADQYGIYNVYNSWFQVFKIIFTLFLFGEVFNVGLIRFGEDRNQFISATLGFITAITGAFFVLYVVCQDLWKQILNLPGYMILLLFANVLSYVPYNCWLRRERFDFRYKTAVAVSTAYVVLQPVSGLLAIRCFHLPINPGNSRIIAAVAVQFLIGMALYAGMMFRGKKFFHRAYWKYSLKTGIVLVPYNLSKVVLNQSDRIMINYFSGKADTGIYSIAHSAAFMVQVVIEGLNGAFVPWLYKKLKKEDYSGIVPVVNMLVLLASAGVFAISIVAPEAMKILADETYYRGVYCIPALSYSVYLIFLYTLLSDIELFYGKNKYVTMISTVGSVTNIVLNMVFIPVYGFVAASYTTLASYAVMCLGNYFFTKKCLQSTGVDTGRIYDLRFVLCCSFALLAFSLVCTKLYECVTVRVVLLVVAALVAVVFRKKLIGMYRRR